MGDNVIDDAQVIFEIDDFTGGGDTGRLIIQSVTITVDRPTNGYSGIGNETEVAVGYGTLSASMDAETVVNERAAAVLEDLYRNDRSPKEVSLILGEAADVRASEFDWNELEVSVEDDGDTMVSMSGKLRGLDTEAL